MTATDCFGSGAAVAAEFAPPSPGVASRVVASGLISLASPIGFEPTAPGLGILCSILLSYGDTVAILHNPAVIQKPQPLIWRAVRDSPLTGFIMRMVCGMLHTGDARLSRPATTG
jgi:hypothetical protein